MSLAVTPATGALGARVEGIDLAAPSPEAFAALGAALARHLVVQVPGQSLDRFQLAALGRRFGPPFLHPIVSNGFADCPEVLELLRGPDDATMFGGESWHADCSWLDPAGHVSILHGIEIPEVGGDTAFASTIAAFARLSPAMRAMLRGLRAVHAYHWFERREEAPHVAVHPVVRRHPATGAEGLYVNRMFTSRFEGMTAAESAPLLGWLFGRMEEHEVTCRFRWTAGDVLLWDNRFTLHYPINDFSGVRRRMIRTTTLEAA